MERTQARSRPCKEAGFEVMDHISVFQDGNDRIAELIKAHADEDQNRGHGGPYQHRRHVRLC